MLEIIRAIEQSWITLGVELVGCWLFWKFVLKSDKDPKDPTKLQKAWAEFKYWLSSKRR